MGDGEFDVYVGLGERMAAFRRSRDLRQRDIAEALGVTRAAISSIESGKQAVAIHQLLQLSSALGVSTIELVPELGENPASKESHAVGTGISVEQEEWISRILRKVEEVD